MHILDLTPRALTKVELQIMLSCFIDKKKLFTLNHLNNLVKNFQYTKAESADKPQTIDKKALDRTNTFLMTSMETRNFAVLLPFMISDVVEQANEDDEFWKNYICLLKITLLVMYPIASMETVQTLKQLIFTHNYYFLKSYPEIPITPKLHYLTHS